jgi:hypothetical protein
MKVQTYIRRLQLNITMNIQIKMGQDLILRKRNLFHQLYIRIQTKILLVKNQKNSPLITQIHHLKRLNLEELLNNLILLNFSRI